MARQVKAQLTRLRNPCDFTPAAWTGGPTNHAPQALVVMEALQRGGAWLGTRAARPVSFSGSDGIQTVT